MRGKWKNELWNGRLDDRLERVKECAEARASKQFLSVAARHRIACAPEILGEVLLHPCGCRVGHRVEVRV